MWYWDTYFQDTFQRLTQFYNSFLNILNLNIFLNIRSQDDMTFNNNFLSSAIMLRTKRSVKYRVLQYECGKQCSVSQDYYYVWKFISLQDELKMAKENQTLSKLKTFCLTIYHYLIKWSLPVVFAHYLIWFRLGRRGSYGG